ncbi:MAG: hypothetical protein HUJ93_01285 [Bacteroidales bacterium]|nr:hypothetical protein [Bacteroidales bacterium]
MHLNIRSYICSICQKSYKRSDHLKRHMITHEPEPNYYECEYCLKKFTFNYHLISHLKNVHYESKQKQQDYRHHHHDVPICDDLIRYKPCRSYRQRMESSAGN